MVKSKAVKSSVGAISLDKYFPGDCVSMDQYVVKESGRLSNGFGREADHNMFHGGTIFLRCLFKIYLHKEPGVVEIWRNNLS